MSPPPWVGSESLGSEAYKISPCHRNTGRVRAKGVRDSRNLAKCLPDGNLGDGNGLSGTDIVARSTRNCV
jgi:hypothetical protein